MKKYLSKLTKITLVLLLVVAYAFFAKPIQAKELSCGEASFLIDANNHTCNCSDGWSDFNLTNSDGSVGASMLCCGKSVGDTCTVGSNTVVETEPDPASAGDSLLELTSETFDSLNPLKISNSSAANDLSTPGGIVTRMLNFLFPLAGLVLFALISWGGFEMLVSATDQKGMEAGKNRITAAVVGFILLFSSYWLAQIVEQIFGISIL